MFGLSWTEIFVILVIALLVMKPEDIPPMIRAVRGFFHKCKELQQEISGSLMEVIDQPEIHDLKKEVQAVNRDIEYIADMEGNLQETYNIKDLLEKKHTTPPSETKAP